MASVTEAFLSKGEQVSAWNGRKGSEGMISTSHGYEAILSKCGIQHAALLLAWASTYLLLLGGRLVYTYPNESGVPPTKNQASCL
jgi:hypothetical protein